MIKNKWNMMLLTLMVVLSIGIFSACNSKTDSAVEGSEKTFIFAVTDADGKETTREIITTKETVGEALLEQGFIDGDEGPYGIYVKVVDGKTLDYDKDGKYWAFYVDGEYAVNGVDKTEIVEGATYAFKAEK